MKGQTCLDGRKQRKNVVAVGATSPTVSTESVLITATIHVHEGHDVSLCKIPGAFLISYMDKDLELTLCGRLGELMVNILSQIYRHHMIYEKFWPSAYQTKQPLP